jgi:hypothetical protein
MNTKWVGRIFLVALMVLIFIAAGGQAVLHLWNWLLPPLFGWREITFWQAVGILALCRILFGNFGGRPMWRSDFRRRMSQRWESMTPEEREKFRQGMRSGCGGFGAPATEAKGQA